MEWVETTGRTLEEAKEAALDQLGVDEPDAEFEVLAEPRPGLFGRIRGEARVRARVRPARPRPKLERRDRRRHRRDGARPEGNGERAGQDVKPKPAPAATEPGPEGQATGAGSRRRRRGGRGGARPSGEGAPARTATEGEVMEESVTVARQAELVHGFVGGLVEAFGLGGSVETEAIDEETVEIRVEGEDLGLLIGPKGQTLAAIQELGRTVVQRQEPGHHEGRVRVDVAGYRQRRREALERFARQVAEDVISSGVQRALEPMGAADRKVVHDAVNELSGVRTISEGVDPHRRVVILPEPGEG